MTLEAALERYLKEVTPGKRPSSQRTEKLPAQILVKHLGRYSLAALKPDVIAQFRDDRLGVTSAQTANATHARTTRFALNWPCAATCSRSR